MKIHPDNVRFVLVEPQTPGNVGSAARAIKTMGFKRLYVVNPCDLDAHEARYMAHASEDVLDAVQTTSTLVEALAGVHFAVATTQRGRTYRLPFYTPAELSKQIIPVTREHEVAIVFGREKTGLTNEELRCCHAVSTIPAAISHPSLNLAQAVMIYATWFFSTSFEEENRFEWRLAEYEETESVYVHLKKTMESVNFVPIDNWDTFLTRFRRMFGRAFPEKRDVQLMHKILQAVDIFVENRNSRRSNE